MDFQKRKKRKHSLEREEVPDYLTNGNGKAKKVIILHPESQIPTALQYINNYNFTKVVAEPNSTRKPPKIFETIIPTFKTTKNDNSNFFLSKIISTKSFDVDVSERFSNKLCGVIEKKNKKSQKSQKETLEEELRDSNGIKEKKKKKKETVMLKTSESGENENKSNLNEENEILKSAVDIYKVNDEKALIFHMHHPCKFSLNGEVNITLISGEVEILGYTLTHESVDVFSPFFCTPLTIETKSVKQNKPVEEIKLKIKEYLSENDLKKIFTNLKSEDSILYLKQITSPFGIVINKYFDKPLFPKDLENVSSKTETLKNLQSIFNFKMTTNGKYFKKSSQWDKIPLGQYTVACGGVGVGKSTLLKYYVNKLITVGEKVLWLDFDPGQPEFTFPGCVSAVIIDQPLLGPNFTHVLDPLLMMSFGDVNVSSNPSKYLECVKYIIESCKKNEELVKMKWFVNTMGFCKGLGVSLTISILKLLKPNTVIQIKGSDNKNNYPFYLTSLTLNSKSGFKSMPLDNVRLSHDLRVIFSCSERQKKQIIGGLKRKEIRDILAVSYFSKMLSPPFYNFNAVVPYLVSFSKIYLGIDFLIDPNDVLKAFNGNTVSLSHFEPSDEEILSVESEEYFKVVIKPNVSLCLGIGFVRGIDCQEKKFYIMTHLSPEILNNVNCLTLGKISPPHSMFLKQENVEGQTVYTTSGSVDVVRKVRRMFRLPGTPRPKEKTDD